MVSRVIYRPFEEGDFPALSTIVQSAWHTSSQNDAYNALEASHDLAHALSISSFSQVVLVDGSPRGIVLARVDGDPIDQLAIWRAREGEILEQMRSVDDAATGSYLSFLKNEERINRRLLAQSGFGWASQVTLLAVDPSTRGMGIGSILLDAATSHASARGAQGAYLYTDTDCSWKFYERRGLRRAASYRATREERKVLPREMYLYGLDLSA
ncbi:MAG: GNAT family N-acetyltransferase [Collinsella sp.]|nr:GNAT family N-acetyltransferase [Collinsella sp.]